MCGLPHISFNFPVELSYLVLCDCHTMLLHFLWNYKPPCFLLFHPLPWCCVVAISSCFFFLSGTVLLFFVWMSHKYPLCLHYHCNNVTHTCLHFLCVTLRFVSFCVITDPFLFLFSVDCHTSKTPLLLPLFSIFGIYTNLFLTTFHVLKVVIHLQWLDLFLSVFAIHLDEQISC